MTTNFTRGSGLLEKFLSEKRAQKANEYIPDSLRQGSILDIGCGFFPHFLVSTKFKKKFGIDPAVNTEIKDINLQKIDIATQKLPFKDNTFEVVTMLAVFEHIQKDKLIDAIKEINRVLKPKGRLIITTPAPWSDKILHHMARVGLISSEEIHDHKSHYGQSKILDIIESGGFGSKKMKKGYFEAYLNMWFLAEK